MTLSQELAWRGFVNQTTFKEASALDGEPITFYFGVDPSADSMTIGNYASALAVKKFIRHGHKAVLLVGGATGLIGDPDGKKDERNLKELDEIAKNIKGITAQYEQIFDGMDFTVVNNHDWFKDINFVDFLRNVGKHVPMRQMLGREFIQSRLGEDSSGISYAEFSYALIQGYDFVHLNKEYGVTLQLCGADQWGNSIAGVDLLRRMRGVECIVYSFPLIVNKTTGVKFGKSEAGAVWLDPTKTSPTTFYQFWINLDDAGVEDYLKVYTELSPDEIAEIVQDHIARPGARIGQTRLAEAVTELAHGREAMEIAQSVTQFLTNKRDIAEADGAVLDALRAEIPSLTLAQDGSIIEALVASGLASSNGEARRLLAGNAIAINGQKVARDQFELSDFANGRALVRRGKAFKDSALVELG